MCFPKDDSGAHSNNLYLSQILSEDCLSAANVPPHFPGKCVFPPLLNDESVMMFGRAVAAEIIGADHVHDIEASMTGEDFAYFAVRSHLNYPTFFNPQDAYMRIHLHKTPTSVSPATIFQERVPASFFFLGTGNATKGTNFSLHSSKVHLDGVYSLLLG